MTAYARNDRVRVLHIIGDSCYGGIAGIILGLGRTAQSEGWQVDVLTTNPVVQEAFARQSLGIVNLDVIRREMRPLWDLMGLIRLSRFLRSQRYRIVHTHTSKGGFVGRLAAWLAGVPIIVHTAHGFAIHEQSPAWARIAYSWLERLAARWCHRIVSVSEFHRGWAVQLGICQAGQIQAIPNGITPLVRTDGSATSGLRRQLEVGDSDLLILSAARLAPDKGLTHLIEAAAVLPHGETRYRFAIAGEGPVRESLERLVQDRGVSERVTFLGFRRDIGDLLAACDLVVLPSLREGLSISLLEAMAAGKPIIATSIGSHREVASQAEMACLVPPANPAALADAIQQFARDPALRAHLAGGARALFEARYTEERMLNEYRQLYLELLDGMQPAPSGCGTSVVRNAAPKDLDAIVGIHQRAFGEFFLTQMGSSFLRMYYQFVLNYHAGILLVGEKHGAISGFVCGFADPAKFYQSMWLNRRDFALPALAALVRHPLLAANILQSVRRIQTSAAQGSQRSCELSSIAVVPELSGNGLGKTLLRSFLSESWSKLAEYVYLTTDASANDIANKLYCDVGFRQSRCFLQRKGRWMNEYVFHRSAADRPVEIHS